MALSPPVLAMVSVPSWKMALELVLLAWVEAYCESVQSTAAGDVGIIINFNIQHEHTYLLDTELLRVFYVRVSN